MKCSLPGCPHLPVTQLKAQPSGVVHPERVVFDFCADHAAEYEAKGYRRV